MKPWLKQATSTVSSCSVYGFITISQCWWPFQMISLRPWRQSRYLTTVNGCYKHVTTTTIAYKFCWLQYWNKCTGHWVQVHFAESRKVHSMRKCRCFVGKKSIPPSLITFFSPRTLTLPCLTPPSGRTPWDIVIYAPLKSAFNELQFRRWHYKSIFIRFAVVASQNRKIIQNSDIIWPYSSSRSSKVIDLGINRKLTCDFLLVTNSNFGRICYRFRDIDA